MKNNARATIKTVSDFLCALDCLEDPAAMMYRGQSQDWPLLPSIGRMRRILTAYENWQVLQTDVVERFAKYARPLMNPLPISTEAWLLNAQHYGVPTRLLDWTTNPLKALFWAVEDKVCRKKNGVVWAFSPRYWRDDVLKETLFSETHLTPFLSKHMNARIVAQEACFVAFPLPESKKPLRPMNLYTKADREVSCLERLEIPAASKTRLLRELSVLGVNHRTLFPDLQGLARYIDFELHGQ